MGSRQSAAFVLILVLALSCARPDNRLIVPPQDALAATAQCTSANFDSSAYYRLLDASDPSRGPFATQLRLSQSDALSCGPSREAYRLHWLPSFRNARVITVALVEGSWILTSVDFGDRLWTEWKKGEVPTTKVQRLSPSEIDRIREELKATNFWTTLPKRDNPEVMDGTTMVIEGRSGDRYRAVTRVNKWDGIERVACVLFNIAGTPLPEYPRCPEPLVLPH